jgi:hypothetical protein
MKDVKWRVISPAKHFDPHVVAEVLRGQVDMLVAGRQYTIDGSVVEIGSIGSLSQMGVQMVSEVDRPTVKIVPRTSPSANCPEFPDSSIADHSADASKMVEPAIKQSLTPDTPEETELRKRVLYIAGPMRGIAFFNYPMFDRVAKNLREAGNEVISPADEDRKDGFDPFANPEYANPDACVFPKEMDFHKTVRRCLDAVLRCDEIVLLPGWENSNGAVAELTLAMWLGKRIRHLKIADNGEFYWACYWIGIAGLAVKLRDHHIPEVAAPAPVVVDEDDEDEDILDTAARITRGDRNASYGPPDQDFRRTAGMWSALFASKLQDGEKFEPRDVALAMILLKCSRESHQRKPDNWVDIAGYARCGSMCN